MVGTLIRLRLTVQGHTPSKQRWLGLALGLAAAAGTWSAVITADAGARSDVLMLILTGWLLGWIVGPVLGSGAGFLRPEYFTLLPVDRRRLGAGLLASVLVGVGAAVTALGALALVAHAARTGVIWTVLVAVVCAVLFLVMTVAVSRIVYALLGNAMRSRLGVELAAIQYGLLLATLMAGWLATSPVTGEVPVFLERGFDGHAAAGVLAWSPAGWPVQAIDAAAAADHAAMLGWLALLAGATTLAVAGAVVLLTPYVGSRTMRRHRRPLGSRVLDRSGTLPASPLTAVLGKELRTWVRDPWRSLEIRSSIWFGIFVAGYGAIAGLPEIAVVAGMAVALMVGLSGANLYGFDGTALWQLVVAQSPQTIRADVRGRQLALIVYFGIPAVVLSAAMMVVTGEYDHALPVFAVIVAVVGAGSGLALLLSVIGATPGVDPHRRVNATDAGENQFVLQVGFWVSVLLATPTAATAGLYATDPTWAGALSPAVLVAVALVNGGSVAVGLGWLARRRLSVRLPETFARICYPATSVAGTTSSSGGVLDYLTDRADRSARASVENARRRE